MSATTMGSMRYVAVMFNGDSVFAYDWRFMQLMCDCGDVATISVDTHRNNGEPLDYIAACPRCLPLAIQTAIGLCFSPLDRVMYSIDPDAFPVSPPPLFPPDEDIPFKRRTQIRFDHGIRPGVWAYVTRDTCPFTDIIAQYKCIRITPKQFANAIVPKHW